MARGLFQPVGAPKTGTTHIQDRLYNNRVSLEENGVVYPVGSAVDIFEPALDLLGRDYIATEVVRGLRRATRVVS